MLPGRPKPRPPSYTGRGFLSAPYRLAMSPMASLTGNDSICGVAPFCPGIDVENIHAYSHSHNFLLLRFRPLQWGCRLCRSARLFSLTLSNRHPSARRHCCSGTLLPKNSMSALLFRWNTTCFKILWQLRTRPAAHELKSRLQQQTVWHCPAPSFATCFFWLVLPHAIHNMRTAFQAIFYLSFLLGRDKVFWGDCSSDEIVIICGNTGHGDIRRCPAIDAI